METAMLLKEVMYLCSKKKTLISIIIARMKLTITNLT